ncbi:MAG: hypothetical protein AAF690_20055 [Acidobacteriota bacterium]
MHFAHVEGLSHNDVAARVLLGEGGGGQGREQYSSYRVAKAPGAERALTRR